MLPPGSSSTFSFKISPQDNRYIGTEEIQLGTINNDQLLKIIQDSKDSVDTHSQNSEVGEMHWRNIERCFSNDPLKLANRISGHFVQHYTSLYTLKDIFSHVFKIADGSIPQTILASVFDLDSNFKIGSVLIGLERQYHQQLAIRKTAGLFGQGWSSSLLEISAKISNSIVVLTKHRRDFKFSKHLANDKLFLNTEFPRDQIYLDESNIIYKTSDLLYVIDSYTNLLSRVTNSKGLEYMAIEYDSGKRPICLNHSSGSINITLDYNRNGFISSLRRIRSGVKEVSEVFYSYSDSGLLLTVSGDTSTAYDYNGDGDLTRMEESNGQTTTFSYDENHLLGSQSIYINGHLQASIQTQRHCDGRVDVTVLPLKGMSSSTIYGLRGEVLEIERVGYSIVKYIFDRINSQLQVVIGDEIKASARFNRGTNTLTTVGPENEQQLNTVINGVGQILSMNDGLSILYEGTIENGSLTEMKYRDGTHIRLKYDVYGRISSTSQNGSSKLYEYDTANRLLRVETADGMTFYNYNDEGLLSDIIGPDGSKTSLAYTPRKQPETVVYPDGTTLYYTYNSCNRRSSVVSNTGYNSTYLYDDFCRLSEIVDETGSRIASFEYGEDSRIIRKRLGNGMYINYEYVDYSLKLKHVKTFFPNNSLFSSFTYKYDEFGNVIQPQTDEEQQERGDTTQHQFVYNGDGQVTRTVIGRTVCEYNYTVFGSVSRSRCSDGNGLLSYH